MAFGGFTKNSGPSARPGAPAPAFGHFPRPPSPSSVSPSDIDAREVTHSAPAFEHSYSGTGPSRPLLGMQRIVNPPLRWGETNTSSSRNYDAQTYQRSPELMPRTASSNFRTHNPANIKEVQNIGRTSQADLAYNNSSFSVPARARSPPLALQNNLYVDAQRSPSNRQHQADLAYNNSSFSVPARARSPPLALQNNLYVDAQRSPSNRQHQADLAYNNSSFSVPARARSPPLALQNNLYVDAQRSPSNRQQRPFSSPVLRNQANSYNNYNSPAPEVMASITTVGVAYGSGPIPQSKRTDAPLQKRAISPTLTSTVGASKESTNYPSDGWKRSPIDYSDLDAPEATPSKPVNFERSSTGRDSHPFAATQKASASPIWHHSQPSTSNTSPNVPDDFFANSSTRGFHQPERALEIKHADVPLPKRTRSPDPSYENEPFSRSPVISSDAHKRALDPQSHTLSSVSGQTMGTGAADDKLMHFPAVKKTKLPFVSSSVEETLDSGQEIERELNAKAKRLARFKEELSQPVNSNVQAKRHHQSMPEKQRFSENQIGDANGDSTGGSFLPECEGMASSSSIIGLCSDMCPESERAERERKGDLDQYERLDGDRNLSSEFLAVKKYTRTAEREAELIRPLPILQKTMDYLLNLLDQPYDDKFLGLYNFLWDRMRAIRMDLRMQHIFNLEAISMLEQMIRLHIIAMHELCEYTKGEGFSEGFDAHLNIEQMNKASVELFQFYDDHRKKGIHVLSEREFRGYYALLKLDKHPGYKVEPAELSLDLAKMAPDMRQSPEVLFARDVARACRTGNFIAFFRLARKASYLQACLMHAHFSKLRTQALASLHSGLQNNQGIPVAHIAKWLGMEEEDIENLLEYHGFSVKDFKEPFMMKESAFVNVDNDFAVKRSKLVESKRSRMIVSDISSPPSTTESFAAEIASELRPNRNVELKPTQIQNVLPVNSAIHNDVEMHVPGAIVSPKGNIQKPIHKPLVDLLMRGDEWTGNEVHLASPRPMVLDSPKISSESIQTRVEPAWKPKYDPILRNSLGRTINQESNQTRAESAQKLNYDPVFRNSFGRTIDQDRESSPPITLETAVENKSPILPLDFAVDNQISQDMFVEDFEDAHTVGVEEDNIDEVSEDNYDKEVAEAKLKLILRIWKLRSTKKREARERKLLAANAALSSLSLGPPIWRYEHQSGNHDMFNIDDIMSERREIQERSWSLLNPSDVVATELLLKNPDAKCLCWKMVLCSQEETLLGNDAVPQNEAAQSAVNSWLHSKLIPANNVDDRDLLISSDGLAIWKSWIRSQSGDYLTCCLSVIKNCKFEDLNEGIAGASAVLFLVSDNTPLELQKYRLHDLISSLPSGSRLPLLILSGSGEGKSASSTIAKDLELHVIDNSRVIAFQVIFLKDQKMRKLDGFFSSERLREGLEWLAGQSPPQMTIRRMKTRELVLSYLNSTLDNLDEMNDDRVGPNYCISSFNKVLDHSMNEVAAAALSNPTGWPCPEIGLLQESSDEYKTAAWYLPSLGWSSAARIENLMSALNDSKLPTFTDDLSWLSVGLSTRYDVVNQKLQIENCLKNYLMETAQMMEEALVQKETNMMLQKCTRLELHNATFYIIPNWVSIFRRIFSWRLMNLTRSEVSSVYVLAQQDHSTQGSEVVDNSELRGNTFLPTYIAQPSLDELIEVSCNPDRRGSNDMDYEAFPHSLPMASDGVDILAPNENEETVAQNGTSTDTEVHGGAQIMNATETSNGEADRLSEMLKKCNMLQDLIDKKLSIYF